MGGRSAAELNFPTGATSPGSAHNDCMRTDEILGGLTLCSLLLNVWLEHRFCRRDTALRRKLGSSRTALEASEAAGKASRTALEASEAERDEMRRHFNAQAAELAQYRGRLPADQRLTRVFTGLPPGPWEK